MKRKRFYKLVLSLGYQRNRAQEITTFARRHGCTINMDWRSVSVVCICAAMAVDDFVRKAAELLEDMPVGEDNGTDDV